MAAAKEGRWQRFQGERDGGFRLGINRERGNENRDEQRERSEGRRERGQSQIGGVALDRWGVIIGGVDGGGV